MIAGLTQRLRRRDARASAVRSDWPADRTAEWAWGGSTGAGVRVCIVDSGVETGHPDVRPTAGSFAVRPACDGTLGVVADSGRDSCGHGTACAGIVRQLAPAAEIVSVRVLDGLVGGGDALVAGLRRAVEEGVDIVNPSLATTRRAVAPGPPGLAHPALFRPTTVVA